MSDVKYVSELFAFLTMWVGIYIGHQNSKVEKGIMREEIKQLKEENRELKLEIKDLRQYK